MKKLTTLLLISALVVSCSSKNEESIEERAQRIHQEAITIDTHNDINVANFTDSINYTQRLDTQVNIPKMKEGGLDVTWLIVYTGQGDLSDEGYEKAAENAMSKFKAIHKLCEEIAPDQIGLALTSEDVRALDAEGKKIAMIGVENAYPMGMDLANVEKYHQMGARYVSLAHNGHSQFSDSNTGEAEDEWLHNGLSDLGKQAIAEMNRVGIMIDISHPSKEAMMQMVALSKAPIIASHSSARALCDHSRNLDDEQLLLLKENGGVVQTVAFKSYLNTEKNKAHQDYLNNLIGALLQDKGLERLSRSEAMSLEAEQRDAYYKAYLEARSAAQDKADQDPNAPEGVSVVDFVDHIDYMVDLIGIDHVGISSDFDGGGGIVDWSDASETFNVTLELVKRGYSDTDIKKLWGENLLRVLDEVQAVASSMN
jgi:membrane dipeptidase